MSIRQHYLHYDIRVTPAVHAEAGFKYDSTLGFNDNVGFRFGTCYPWYLYDLKEKKEVSVIEIPLIVQDGAMLNQAKGMRLDEDTAFQLVEFVLPHFKISPAKRFLVCLSDGDWGVVEKTNGKLIILWMVRITKEVEQGLKPMEQITRETTSALVFQAGNPGDLAEKIISLYKSSGLCQQIEEKGKMAAIEGKYRWEYSAK